MCKEDKDNISYSKNIDSSNFITKLGYMTQMEEETTDNPIWLAHHNYG